MGTTKRESGVRKKWVVAAAVGAGRQRARRLLTAKLRANAHLLSHFVDALLPFEVTEGAAVLVARRVQVVIVPRGGQRPCEEATARECAAEADTVARRTWWRPSSPSSG